MKYFAYASNMSATRMRFKRIHFSSAEPAIAIGWELAFNKLGELPGQGYGNLISAGPGKEAEGVLYEIDEADLSSLDAWEKCPEEYERKQIKVITRRGIIVEATLYLAKPAFTAAGLLPTREYLNWILEGKTHLSAAYFQQLNEQKALGE